MSLPVTQHTVHSKDGTAIGYFQSGSGPPLVLVHGTTADHTRWAPVLPELERHFTVYAVDRRGRGASGDAPDYAIEREFEDIATVVDAIGGDVFLLGHSYGAVCSLEATLHTSRVKKLVLYEPPMQVLIPFYSNELVAEIEELAKHGEWSAVVETFFRKVARTPEAELKMIKSLPNWPSRVAAASTIPREMQLDRHYRFDAERFTEQKAPTLLLLGGDSPASLVEATRAVHHVLPASQVSVLPGQKHVAMNTAPGMFLERVFGFCRK